MGNYSQFEKRQKHRLCARKNLDGAEKFLGRRREILRTEQRISPDGSKNETPGIFEATVNV